MEGFTFWEKLIIFGLGVVLFPIFLAISFALFLWSDWLWGVVLIFWIVAMPFFVAFWLVWFPESIVMYVSVFLGPILGIAIFFLHFKMKKFLQPNIQKLREMSEKKKREEKMKRDMRL